MKIMPVLLALVVLGTTRLHGGAQEQIKQRAKTVRDQNNERQSVPGSSPSAQPGMQPAATATQPAPSKPTPTARIKSDLTGWQSEKTVSAELKKVFTGDLLAAVRGSKSPAQASVEKFTDSLATALAAKPLGATQLSRLVQNINLALNSAGLSDERRDEIAAEVQADVESAGVAQAVAAVAVQDLKDLMADLSL